MVDNSLRSTKIMRRISLLVLRDSADTPLGFLRINLRCWLAYWISTPVRRARVSSVFVTHSIFPSSHSKMYRDSYQGLSRNITALFDREQNCCLHIVNRPFQN